MCCVNIFTWEYSCCHSYHNWIKWITSQTLCVEGSLINNNTWDWIVSFFFLSNRASRMRSQKHLTFENKIVWNSRKINMSTGTGKELILDLTKHPTKRSTWNFSEVAKVLWFARTFNHFNNSQSFLHSRSRWGFKRVWSAGKYRPWRDCHILDPRIPTSRRQRREISVWRCAGALVMLICPDEGMEEISNPFNPQAEEW